MASLNEVPVANLDLCDLYRQLSEVNLEHELAKEKFLWAQRMWLCRQERKYPSSRTRMSEIKTTHDELESAYQLLDERQNSLREDINIYSRPHIRSLHILNLPDEILVNIAGNFQDWNPTAKCWSESPVEFSNSPYGPGRSLSDIKNLRLTCRRLCNTSSAFLISELRVDFNPLSLSKLEDISRHPTISKGVRFVRLELLFRESDLASDIQIFAECVSDDLSQEIFDEEIPPASGGPSERVKEGKAILRSWRSRYGLPDSDLESGDSEDEAGDSAENVVGEADASHQMLIEKGYEEYHRLFLEQERLQENGTFVQAVATAIARMPLAKRLRVSHRCSQRKLRSLDAKTNDAMSEALLHNMSFPHPSHEPAGEYEPGKSPMNILVRLLGAIYKAGVFLTHLGIMLVPPCDLAALDLSEKDRCDLIAAMQSLRCFNFAFSEPCRGVAWESEEFERLHSVIGALLHTESIEEIGLWFGDLFRIMSSNDILLNTCSFINSRPWRKLRSLVLTGVSLNIADLEQFIESRAIKMDGLRIRRTRLTSGTWADVLDVLKGKTNSSSIEFPSGAECVTELTVSEKRDIFAGSFTSKAAVYMKWGRSRNPIRKLLHRKAGDEDMMSPDTSDEDKSESSGGGNDIESEDD